MRYLIYLRSMTTYRTSVKPRYYINLDYLTVVGNFSTYDEAKEHLFKIGPEITEKFSEIHQQGCALLICEQRNFELGDDLDDYVEHCKSDLNLLGNILNHNNYVFSDESYKMLLNEQEILHSNDWAKPIPYHIYLVKNNNIYRGFSDEHFNYLIKNYY